ncbi:MAG: TlpA family protein disulfide reductase [Candidatus Acidiferrales bacterium]
MKKTFIFLLAIIAGLAGLAIGFAATRSGHIVLAKAARVAHLNAASKNSSAAAKQDADDKQVIRFASNPEPVPPFLLSDLDGNPVSTATWKGKVVLLTFWATWCPPCREEIPMLIALQNRYKDRLQIIGASIDDAPPGEVKEFARQAGINYPIVMAGQGLVKEYGGVPALPTMFVVDRDGRVVQKHEGLFPEYVYEEEVRSLLGLPVDATVETFEDNGQIFLKNAALARELPDVDFNGLTAAQKQEALKRLNTQECNCGCTLTLAQCRINDTTCPISKDLAAKVVKDVVNGVPAPAAATPPADNSAPTGGQSPSAAPAPAGANPPVTN